MKMSIIWILTLLSTVSCKTNPESEDYLIPKGFIGRATVIFNQEKGVPPKYENGRRIYELPPNGILVTQFKAEYGIIDHRYFYVDSSGNRTQLDIFQDESFKDSTISVDRNKIGIFSDGITGQYAEGKKAPFQFFFVSSYNSFNKIESYDSFNKRINKLMGFNL